MPSFLLASLDLPLPGMLLLSLAAAFFLPVPARLGRGASLSLPGTALQDAPDSTTLTPEPNAKINVYCHSQVHARARLTQSPARNV